MFLIVGIDTAGAAFHAHHGPEGCVPACEDMLRGEVADILRRLRVAVTNEVTPSTRTEDDPFVLFDSNGNRVGVARFEGE